MIKRRRHIRILAVLRRDGVIDLNELARLMPEASKVTLRRDLAELAEAGALKRTHGGAVLPDAQILRPRMAPANSDNIAGAPQEQDNLDAIILPPIPGRGGDALRRHFVRRAIPFIAESAPQPGGVYLGPDNFRAGYDLGLHAGRECEARETALLLVGHPELPNTRDRLKGFEAGFCEAFAGTVTAHRVNGQGSYKVALRVAQDALRTDEAISIAFGVNDHSALAAMEAAQRQGRSLSVYASGGESAGFVARLTEDDSLRAVAAFFPEVVGARAIDLTVTALSGSELPDVALTPHAIVTAGNIRDYYEKGDDGWQLRPDSTVMLLDAGCNAVLPDNRRRACVGFMPHFPAHDWYRVLVQSMRARAEAAGLNLAVSPPHKGIAVEISRLRRKIAETAAHRVAPGQTIIVGEGETGGFLADALRRIAFATPGRINGVTVITNAFDVLHKLEDAPDLRVVLTSGEYQKADRCLVGPSLGALFERMRADLAFLTVSGVSSEFGLSSDDERRALAGTRFCQAAQRVIAMADHTTMGVDANHRIAPAGEFHEVITDDGALPANRQKLRDTGTNVLIAGDEHSGSET